MSQQGNSETDNYLIFIKQITLTTQTQSTYLTHEIVNLKTQLQSLTNTIQNKNQSCHTEIKSKINQLQSIMTLYNNNIQSMNQIALKELQEEKHITNECQLIIEGFQTRIISLNESL